jgi:predicted metalloprotease with PDZ domain
VEQAVLPCKENIFIQVAGIISGSPAAKAGLKDDDIILSLNGEPTCNDAENIISTFKNRIDRQLIGASVTLDILRGDQKLSLPALLKAVPYHEQREAMHQEIEKCPERTSKLESVMHSRNALLLYDKISYELYRKSNQVHNPGSAVEEHSTRPVG